MIMVVQSLRHVTSGLPQRARELFIRGASLYRQVANGNIGTQPSKVETRYRISEQNLFGYQGQRWLWNEQEQLKRRHLQFDLGALICVAEEATGHKAVCNEVKKLPEGNYNKVLLMTMRDQRQVVARLPNPNAGFSHYTTASEVATMGYVRSRLQIPIPKVLSYSTKANANTVGAEHIIMEKCPGIELARVWNEMPGKDKTEVVKQVATFSSKLFQARFPHYGSLYYSKDIPDIKGTEVDGTFSVGPTTGRSWFDNRKGQVNVSRGLWNTAQEVLTAIVNGETACLDAFSDFPRDRQQGMCNGPGGYEPSKTRKKRVMQDFSRILPFILPKEKAFTASVLWHNDLHLENILVNRDCPRRSQIPALLHYDGPKLGECERPKLPDNFAELNPISKKTARDLHTAQCLWGMFKILALQSKPDWLSLLRYQDTLPAEIMNLIGLTYADGEPYVQSLIADLCEKETWGLVVEDVGGSAAASPCPLAYMKGKLAQQQEDLERWTHGVEMKTRAVEEVGAYTDWNGAVLPDEYSAVSGRLQNAKERFMHTVPTTREERAQWERVWPFQHTLMK